MTDAAPAEGAGRVRPVAAAVCVVAGAVTWLVPSGLAPAAQATLAILVAVGGLWVTESLPLGATSLLVPVLGIALGAAKPAEAFSGFSDPTVFLFLGTFLLADAVSQHGLDRRLADSVLSRPAIRRSPRRFLWALGLVGCFVSAWVSNTATAAILLPVALTAERLGSKRFLAAVLLATAYAPSLGGLATKIGTPPNLIGIGAIEKASGREISFLDWAVVFAPLALVSTVGVLAWLTWLGGPVPPMTNAPPTERRREWSRAERAILVVFLLVVAGWIVPGALANVESLKGSAWVAAMKQRLPEASVPLLGAALLFVIPSGAGGASVLTSGAFRRLDWGTILLFGGGLSLGAMMQTSGLARTVGEAIFRGMPAGGTFAIALAAALMAIVMSEFTSNTAAAAIVVPVVIELARAAGVSPAAPALAATAACSFGFMLPVSTPPNALVYGTGKLTIAQMVKCGILLDLGGAVLVAAWVTLFI